MTEQPRPGRRPGRPPSLTRDDLARAALEEGMETLSMPAVARRLGVGHSTLYRYVHDRDDLVLAALDLAIREFAWPSPELPWRDLLLAFADALWRFLERSPGIGEAVLSSPGLPPGVTELLVAYGSRLRADGLSERDTLVVLDLVADLTIATEISMRGLDRVFDTPRGRRSLREIYQTTWEAVAPDNQDAFHGRGWLDEKLTILLDGLASRIGPVPPSTMDEQAEPARVPDRDEVVAAGRALARREGLAAVTLRSVAAGLGCTATTLRRLVGDRDGLVVAMLDAVADEIVAPPPGADPRAELIAVTWAVYEALREDPWAVHALAVDGLAGPLILPLLDRVLAALSRAGVPDGELAGSARILWAHLFGAALSAANTDDESFGTRMARSAVPALASRGAAAHDERALRGISLVVDGLITR